MPVAKERLTSCCLVEIEIGNTVGYDGDAVVIKKFTVAPNSMNAELCCLVTAVRRSNGNFVQATLDHFYALNSQKYKENFPSEMLWKMAEAEKVKS